eukprot:CAMPEP_0168816434 /NCGR_PEP_ID=MMETSP0726-20121227/6719_1 /TAXON_ID=265536 /ORGANISM="Amphiprora sp., Strain CCMP467" /LENGTH=236 /DNA_ID=CAMNT_0008868689 /DNA_START=5 /DNA_END=715 /DNA_ORIENTATION=+
MPERRVLARTGAEHSLQDSSLTNGGDEEKTMPERKILVLYGSTRGASQKAAERFVEDCDERLSPDEIREITGSDDIDITLSCQGPIALDNFLKDPEWAPLVVIFVSSFGSGDGPRNGRKFRKKCDAWTQVFQGNPDKPKPLAGMRFALCGLGESTYQTYMKNPIVTCDALTLLGAEIVGERGFADSVEGEPHQQIEIATWQEEMWAKLAEVLVQKPAMTEEQLAAAREFVLQDAKS